MPSGIATYLGSVAAADLGVTLMHEHVFVRDHELERNVRPSDWDEAGAIDRAVRGLTELHRLGVRTVVDLTVIGLGRDVDLVRRVAERVPVALVAATGVYAPSGLSIHFRARGPGTLVGGADPLVELFVRDIEEGIASTAIRAGMIKVMSSGSALTLDERRVFAAAAAAHLGTGVPITTHSDPRQRNGLDQLAALRALGVSPTRIIVGHSGDTDEEAYLRALMDAGSTIGMDRFGMEHVLADEQRIDTVVRLARAGYSDRMILSHDAAFFSHVTPPSWRAVHAPRWEMSHLSRDIVPALAERGVPESDIERMLVGNPRRLLEPAIA